MNSAEQSRRAFVAGLGTVIAAPAIVPFASLIPVRGIVMAVDKFSAPSWFDEYDTQMWNKLMTIGRVQERIGRPIGENIAEAMRTCMLPWWLQHAEKMQIPPDVAFD